VTNEEKLVWAAAFAEAHVNGNPYPAIAAHGAVAKLRASSLASFATGPLGNSKEIREASEMLAEMQGKDAA
jgi:hypothetical protein